MAKFWDLVAESVIVQALVTLALVGACIVMAAQGREIPPLIGNCTLLALGFYFGSKTQLAAIQQAKGR